MLASRACRSSIMIGRPLRRRAMERVLAHLAGLRAPWNCPHGRPTMRHLAVLKPQARVGAAGGPSC
jgi:DNA mismatch repair protein PMS2